MAVSKAGGPRARAGAGEHRQLCPSGPSQHRNPGVPALQVFVHLKLGLLPHRRAVWLAQYPKTLSSSHSVLG